MRASVTDPAILTGGRAASEGRGVTCISRLS
jgi:hypothetical protein